MSVKDVKRTGKIYNEITQKHIRQDEQWGGPEHDGGNSVSDWYKFCEKFLRRSQNEDPKVFRENMVKVAALVVASLERFDRNYKGIMSKEAEV